MPVTSWPAGLSSRAGAATRLAQDARLSPQHEAPRAQGMGKDALYLIVPERDAAAPPRSAGGEIGDESVHSTITVVGGFIDGEAVDAGVASPAGAAEVKPGLRGPIETDSGSRSNRSPEQSGRCSAPGNSRTRGEFNAHSVEADDDGVAGGVVSRREGSIPCCGMPTSALVRCNRPPGSHEIRGGRARYRSSASTWERSRRRARIGSRARRALHVPRPPASSSSA